MGLQEELQGVQDRGNAQVSGSHKSSVHALLTKDRDGEGGLPAHEKIVAPVADGSAVLLAKGIEDILLFLHGGVVWEGQYLHRQALAHLAGSAVCVSRQHVDLEQVRELTDLVSNSL